jgi:NAD(P)-dependent dehydrogenase (short-subunit alcohol dehydrogenase family)
MAQLSDKICLVTGATNGIGKVTARELAKMGATVVVAGRSREKTESIVAELRAAAGHDRVIPMLADLSLLSGCATLAAQFRAKFDRLDILVNNAGGIFNQRQLTSEGLEMTFALNHMSYFAVTTLLLDLLKRSESARVVSVSSGAHFGTRSMDWDNLQGEKRYVGFTAYSSSKLANVLFTYELARQMAGSRVTANVLHPGAVSTGFGTNNQDIFSKLLFKGFQLVAIPVEKGARTSIYLASSPEVEGVTGKYYSEMRETKSSPISYDAGIQSKLWEISAALMPTTVKAGV